MLGMDDLHTFIQLTLQISSYFYTVILTPLLARGCHYTSRKRVNDVKGIMTPRVKTSNKSINVTHRREKKDWGSSHNFPQFQDLCSSMQLADVSLLFTHGSPVAVP